MRGVKKTLMLLMVSLLAFPLAGCCDLAIETAALPPGQVGQPYSFEMDSDCGGDFWFLSEGTLPAGISFRSDGVLSGTPTSAGTFLITLGVDDIDGGQVFKGFSLTILGPPAPPLP